MFTLQDREIHTVILDRDGVLNRELGDYVKHVSQWQWIDQSLEAVVKLYQSGINLFVATNQAGIGRGLYTIENLNDIHQKLLDDIHNQNAGLHHEFKDSEVILFCPHHPDENCSCRKPKSGMLQRIRDDFQTDLNHACMIGDSQRDLQAALKENVLAVHVKSGKGADISDYLKQNNIPQYNSLADFVNTHIA